MVQLLLLDLDLVVVQVVLVALISNLDFRGVGAHDVADAGLECGKNQNDCGENRMVKREKNA